MRTSLVVISFLFLSACATNHSPSASNWRGQSADLLMQRIGAPKAIMPATNGNTLFIYTTDIKTNYPSSVSNPTVFVGPKGKTFAANNQVPPAVMTVTVCTTTYEVNKQHMIVSVTSKGSRCY